MPVVSYVPLMMFAILFGLSMDYQVFLVSRLEERHQGGADNSEAVRAGLVNAGKPILAAATIMFAVFFSFVINGNPIVKQFGVGLAVVRRDRRARRPADHAGRARAARRAQLVHAALARPDPAQPLGGGRSEDEEGDGASSGVAGPGVSSAAPGA